MSLADAMAKLEPGANNVPNPEKNKASISESEMELLLKRLRSIANAQTAEEQMQFTIPGFSAAFQKDDPAEFENFFKMIYGGAMS